MYWKIYRASVRIVSFSSVIDSQIMLTILQIKNKPTILLKKLISII